MKTRKTLTLMIAFAMMLSVLGFVPQAMAEAAPETAPAYQARATVSEGYNIPLMDGVIDTVWETTEAIWSHYNHAKDTDQAYGYSKVLWTETELYLMAVVYDPTLEGLAEDNQVNAANFFVSETASQEAAFGTLPGDWDISISSSDHAFVNLGKDVTENAMTGAMVYDGYYVVEATLPIMTEDLTYKAGHVIGYNFSVMDDNNADGTLDAFATWQEGWQAPAVLGKVMLVNEDLPQVQAAYAETAPVIDGEYDEVWDATQALNVKVNWEEGQATGYAKILWAEDTLYLLAVVDDPTMEGIPEDSTANLANFFVSETASSELAYGNIPGDWHLAFNMDGKFQYYTGNDMTDAGTYAIKKLEGYYVVETAVPVQSEGLQYKEGHLIGFNISIDDDTNGDNLRDFYATWQIHLPNRAYWAVPEWLNKVELVKTLETPDVYGPSMGMDAE